jgi:hypothetical protein
VTAETPSPAPLDGPGVLVADPRELLLGYLDWYRDALMRKLAGLPEARLRTPVEPLGWAPLGLVKHLGWVERRWIRWGFAAEDVVAYPRGGDAEEWGVTEGETSASILSGYRAEVRRSAEIIAGAKLTDVASLGGRFATPADAPPLARILFHLLQEYARHTGHLDIARELIDGTTGE